MPMYPFRAWRRDTRGDASVLYMGVYENVARRREGGEGRSEDPVGSSYFPAVTQVTLPQKRVCISFIVYVFMSTPDITA